MTTTTETKMNPTIKPIEYKETKKTRTTEAHYKLDMIDVHFHDRETYNRKYHIKKETANMITFEEQVCYGDRYCLRKVGKTTMPTIDGDVEYDILLYNEKGLSTLLKTKKFDIRNVDTEFPRNNLNHHYYFLGRRVEAIAYTDEEVEIKELVWKPAWVYYQRLVLDVEMSQDASYNVKESKIIYGTDDNSGPPSDTPLTLADTDCYAQEGEKIYTRDAITHRCKTLTIQNQRMVAWYQFRYIKNTEVYGLDDEIVYPPIFMTDFNTKADAKPLTDDTLHCKTKIKERGKYETHKVYRVALEEARVKFGEFKEDLIRTCFHPTRVERMVEMYGNDWMERV